MSYLIANTSAWETVRFACVVEFMEIATEHAIKFCHVAICVQVFVLNLVHHVNGLVAGNVPTDSVARNYAGRNVITAMKIASFGAIINVANMNVTKSANKVHVRNVAIRSSIVVISVGECVAKVVSALFVVTNLSGKILMKCSTKELCLFNFRIVRVYLRYIDSTDT